MGGRTAGGIIGGNGNDGGSTVCRLTSDLRRRRGPTIRKTPLVRLILDDVRQVLVYFLADGFPTHARTEGMP